MALDMYFRLASLLMPPSHLIYYELDVEFIEFLTNVATLGSLLFQLEGYTHRIQESVSET